MKEKRRLVFLVILFIVLYFVPLRTKTVSAALLEAFFMLQEYVQQHVLLCLIPAFFIAGAIANFISQGSIIRYFGPRAKKVLSYAVASVSGTLLAVCSCTVLPLFAGIYKKGAGIGPAIAFLYSAPAINVLAIILTARVLGLSIGIARAVGAVAFSVVIGSTMHLIFIKDERARTDQADLSLPDDEKKTRPLWKTMLPLFTIILIIVFINWNRDEGMELWNIIYRLKYIITGFLLVFLLFAMLSWFKRQELKDWVSSSWDFAKQILPLLFAGVMAAGFLLGRPGHEGVIPFLWIKRLVGGNSIRSNLFASVTGALMYFATLTEIPILQGLLGSGMGKGPAVALLLSGPALSLPNMLVLQSVIGLRKTVVYILLVIIMATFSGFLFGSLF